MQDSSKWTSPENMRLNCRCPRYSGWGKESAENLRID
jgi:hypothetical protein